MDEAEGMNQLEGACRRKRLFHGATEHQRGSKCDDGAYSLASAQCRVGGSLAQSFMTYSPDDSTKSLVDGLPKGVIVVVMSDSALVLGLVHQESWYLFEVKESSDSGIPS